VDTPFANKGYVCDVLNVEQFRDKLLLLGHLRKFLSSFEGRHIAYLNEYHKKSQQTYSFSPSSIEYFKKLSDDYECMAEWSKKEIARMEPLRVQYLKELSAAKEKLDIVESGNPSRHPHYNDYRNAYNKLKRKSHGLTQSLAELDGYGQ